MSSILNNAADHAISEKRTRNYIHQIKGSAVFKALGLAASFLALPCMIRYLGPEQFGIWSTILSMMSWAMLFDLGIGNVLRNKIAEALAKNDVAEASSYISSAYSLIAIIAISLCILMAIAGFNVRWQQVFNTRILSERALRQVILTSGFFVFLSLWTSLITQVLNAMQKSSAIAFGQFFCNVLVLAFAFVLLLLGNASLLYLAVCYGVSLITSHLLLSLRFYRNHIDLRPKASLSARHLRPLFSIGIQFFVLQLSYIAIFTIDRILILHLFGPQYVAQYDIVFKLFSAITLVHLLITAPLWSSYADAYHRQDFPWIMGIMKKQLAVFGAVALSVLIMALIAKPLIAIWIGPEIDVPVPLVLSMGTFVLISCWNGLYSHFLNGVGKIKTQLFLSVIAAAANIPLAFFFTHYCGMGVEGIVWAMCASLSLFAVAGPLQAYFLLKGRAA